jgi:hypothetical protein
MRASASRKERPRAVIAPAMAMPSARFPTRVHSSRASAGSRAGSSLVHRLSSSSACSPLNWSTGTSAEPKVSAVSGRREVYRTTNPNARPTSASTGSRSQTLSSTTSTRLPACVAAILSRPWVTVLKLDSASDSPRRSARSARSVTGSLPGPASSHVTPSLNHAWTRGSWHACAARVDLPVPPIPVIATDSAPDRTAATMASDSSGRATSRAGTRGGVPRKPGPTQS